MSDIEQICTEIVVAVAELPDRTSPEDWPEAMLVTAPELHEIVKTHVTELVCMYQRADAWHMEEIAELRERLENQRP